MLYKVLFFASVLNFIKLDLLQKGEGVTYDGKLSQMGTRRNPTTPSTQFTGHRNGNLYFLQMKVELSRIIMIIEFMSGPQEIFRSDIHKEHC